MLEAGSDSYVNHNEEASLACFFVNTINRF